MIKVKVLFATTNPAKIKYYAKELEKRGIQVLTLKDLDLMIDIEENGKSAKENACIKAKTYYQYANMITISIDDSLYIEGLSEEKQPGVNVRRVNGKRLLDEEMLRYYSNLVKDLGGKADAKWVKSVCVYNGKEMKTYTYHRSKFYFVDKPSKQIHEGYPLDSLAIIPEFGHYLSELTDKEKEKYKELNNNQEIFDFMIQSIMEESKSQYLASLSNEIKDYFHILNEDFPQFLEEYMMTEPMQRIGKIGTACGTDYTKLFNNQYFYTNLEHSIGVALIIWHFTKDQKQTLAGLFHDIATPVFKHCIDFMNGDHEKQESTEELTEKMIRDSQEIMYLLNRDHITVEEVMDYHRYPIADNDTPRLSADRLEYTFSNGLYFKKVWDLKQIKQIYDNLEVQRNEENISELGFKDLATAEKFIDGARKLWPLWISNKEKITLQFIADIMKKLSEKNIITKEELYTLSEQEVIKKIENCGDSKIQNAFLKFRKATEIEESEEPIKGKYCISIKAKRRYIIPLVSTKDGYVRINEISRKAKKQIEEYLQFETKKYAALDIEF